MSCDRRPVLLNMKMPSELRASGQAGGRRSSWATTLVMGILALADLVTPDRTQPADNPSYATCGLTAAPSAAVNASCWRAVDLRQAEASALPHVLGGEEWLEDPADDFGVDAIVKDGASYVQALCTDCPPEVEHALTRLNCSTTFSKIRPTRV